MGLVASPFPDASAEAIPRILITMGKSSGLSACEASEPVPADFTRLLFIKASSRRSGMNSLTVMARYESKETSGRVI